ncbi:RASGRF1 (predicted) [Pycnogonum litorale]
MVEMEEEYVAQLQLLISCFLRPFKMAASSKTPPCSHDDVNSIFLNSETVMFLHQIFIKGLTARMESWPTLVLGDLFDMLLPMLSIYQEYVRNHHYSLQVLAECKQREKFVQLLKRLEDKSALYGRSIETFLTYPMHQVPRYIITLHELLAHTPYDHVERRSLDAARIKLEELSRQMHDEVSETENIRKNLAIERMITEGCDILLDVTQVYVRQGSLIQVLTSEKSKSKAPRLGKSEKEAVRQIFLFTNHMLLATRTSGGRLHLVPNIGKIPLADATLIEDLNDQFTFTVTNEDESASICSTSSQSSSVSDGSSGATAPTSGGGSASSSKDYQGLDFKIIVDSKTGSPLTVHLVAPTMQEKTAWASDISQCIDNIHFNDLLQRSMTEESSVTMPHSIRNDPRLFKDDVDIRFSRTLNSCKVPQIRYASLERLFERLTDLRFLSIDFLNTFLLTYRSFTDGVTVLEALKKVYYNPDKASGEQASTSLHGSTGSLDNISSGEGSQQDLYTLTVDDSYYSRRISTGSMTSDISQRDRAYSYESPFPGFSVHGQPRPPGTQHWRYSFRKFEEEQKEQGLKRIRETSPVSPTAGISTIAVPSTTTDHDEGICATTSDVVVQPAKTKSPTAAAGNLLTIPSTQQPSGSTLTVEPMNPSQSSETLTLTDSNSCQSSPTTSPNLSTSTNTLIGSSGGTDGGGSCTPASSPKHTKLLSKTRNIVAWTKMKMKSSSSSGVNGHQPSTSGSTGGGSVSSTVSACTSALSNLYKRTTLKDRMPDSSSKSTPSSPALPTKESKHALLHSFSPPTSPPIASSSFTSPFRHRLSSTGVVMSLSQQSSSVPDVSKDISPKTSQEASTSASGRSSISAAAPPPSTSPRGSVEIESSNVLLPPGARAHKRGSAESDISSGSLLSPNMAAGMSRKRGSTDTESSYMSTPRSSLQTESTLLSTPRSSFQVGDSPQHSSRAGVVITSSRASTRRSSTHSAAAAFAAATAGASNPRESQPRGHNRLQSAGACDLKIPKDFAKQKRESIINTAATMRVLNVLRHWVSKHSQDFESDKKLYSITVDFLEELVCNPNLLPVEHKAAAQLLQMLTKFDEPNDKIDLDVLLAPSVTPSKDNIETLSALEIAEQITYLDHKIFVNIRSEEFLGQAWMKLDRTTKAPHILLITRRFNDVSRLVVSEVIRRTNMSTRVSVIEKWTAVADICRCMHNFNGVLQICAAFTNSSVFRLKKTWERVSKTSKQTVDKLQVLVSADGRFRNLREALHRCDPPCIPYLGMYLTDLSFIEEGTPNCNEEGLLNFSKMRMIAHAIREIRHFQQVAYKVEINSRVTNYLLDPSLHLPDEHLYRMSLNLEPRLSRLGTKYPNISATVAAAAAAAAAASRNEK